ncbi:SDR family NAD(P)-dependent oxidoreductase [Dactylosporangium matsuzakiense]|uniref:3-ketoacyl-ACP reductase n=1 Tax=Dactylosporangium matsuzakiense TaxID=53360 RepID=A0A9W6NR34_9ACTN|nr:SDR family oxidoreductase [Dactylosporangium matsuzakiense]UWZ43734.1 SDR family oxidoreductase [Dactylosporangium matsuzakiense]GLL05772.1 3-ketoacyl-ACP reductase [Dactylosporangium matsuzakiense]
MAARRVLITGAARGIGAAVARAFAAAGDTVAVHRRTPAEPDLPGDLLGGGHTVVAGDLADPEAVRTLVDRAAEALGGLDVVVNNAAVYIEHRILDVSYEQWQRAWHDTLAVDLLAPANVSWCAARHLGRGGRIINVSSRGAYRGEPDHPAYGAAKAALNSMTQSLARALAPKGIAVSAVAPGFVATDLVADLLASPEGDAIRAQSPFNRVATPEEVAAAVLHLASPQAEWSSGAVLDLNGASYFR